MNPAIRGMAEAQAAAKAGQPSRFGLDLALVLAEIAAMAAGATLLVEAVQRISGRRGDPDSARPHSGRLRDRVRAGGAGLVGGASGHLRGGGGRRGGQLRLQRDHDARRRRARPAASVLDDAAVLHGPLLVMLGSLALVIALAMRRGSLARTEGTILLAAYPVLVVWVLAG